MGGVMTEIYPGSVWIRKAIAGFGALMISGLLRFAEHMVALIRRQADVFFV
jgi:hypothetical protein